MRPVRRHLRGLGLLATLLASPTRVVAGDSPAAPAAPVSARSVAARVVAGVARAAKDNAALPPPRRLTGDALAEAYVRRAAADCEGDDKAFWVGLSKALDPSGTLERFPLTAKAFAGLETVEEAAARREVMGVPTLRGRNDRLLHFVVSATLQSRLGEAAATAAGIAKELADMKGSEGFSVGDLLADRAGIVCAQRIAAGDVASHLALIAREFAGTSVLPDDAGLPDALSAAEFEQAYGGIADPRFVALRRRLAASVDALPFLRPPPPPKAPEPAPGADPGAVPAPPADGRRDPSPKR